MEPRPPASGRPRNHLSLLLRGLSLATGGGATVWVAARVGASPGDLLSLPLPAHLLALGCAGVEVVARAVRIRALARDLHLPLGLRTAVRAQLAADAAGAVTPSKVGSDPTKLWVMGADGAPLGGRGAVLLGEMAWEAGVLVVVGLLLAVWVPGNRMVPLAVLAYAVVVLALGGLSLTVATRAGSRPPGWWGRLRLAPSRWHGLREQGRSYVEHARRLGEVSPRGMTVALLATVTHMAARVLILLALVAGWTGLPETGAGSLVLWPFGLLYLGSLLPPPGGGGVLEVGFAAALDGILPAAVLPTALLWWRVYTFYLPAALGGVILLRGRRTRT